MLGRAPAALVDQPAARQPVANGARPLRGAPDSGGCIGGGGAVEAESGRRIDEAPSAGPGFGRVSKWRTARPPGRGLARFPRHKSADHRPEPGHVPGTRAPSRRSRSWRRRKTSRLDHRSEIPGCTFVRQRLAARAASSISGAMSMPSTRSNPVERMNQHPPGSAADLQRLALAQSRRRRNSSQLVGERSHRFVRSSPTLPAPPGSLAM